MFKRMGERNVINISQTLEEVVFYELNGFEEIKFKYKN